MSSLSVADYDVVVHLAESVLNRGLELIPNGSTFPVDVRNNATLTPTVGATDVPLVYDALVELDRPQITIDQANQRVVIRCDLSPASELTFLGPLNGSQASLLTNIVQQIPLGGTLELSCPFGTEHVTSGLGGQTLAGTAAVANAMGVVASLSLVIPSATGASVTLAKATALGGALISVTVASIASALEAAIGTSAGNAIGVLPLTNPVRLNVGTSPPQIVRSLVAQISPPGSPPAVSLGVLTGIMPANTGLASLPAPPTDLVDGVMSIANYWTLQLICTAIMQAHPGVTFTFDRTQPNQTTATFAGAVAIPGGPEPLVLKELTLTAGTTGSISVSGGATARADCWYATIDFDFELSFLCDPTTGGVVAAATPPHVTAAVGKHLWCEIVGAIVGAVLGFVTGAIIGGIIGGSLTGGGVILGALIGGVVGGVVGGVGGFVAADALIDPINLNGISLDTLSVLGGLTLPLPLGAAGFLVDHCDFDDLAVRGRFAYVDFAARHRAGTIELAPGQAFDLDAGVVRTGLDGTTDDSADLLWSGAQLQTIMGATLGAAFAAPSAFDTTSLTALDDLSYAAGALLVARRGALAFAARTDGGRYAKCRVFRTLRNALSLEYVVYEQPHPCLGTNLTISTTSKKVVDHGKMTCTTSSREPTVGPGPIVFPFDHVNVHASAAETTVARLLPAPAVMWFPPKPDDCGGNTTVETEDVSWEVVNRARKLVLRALPRGATAPLVYHWNVFGTDLSGHGTTTLAGVKITYDEQSPVLTMHAPEGVDVATSVVIAAIDADGRTLTSVRSLQSVSRKRIGGCCDQPGAKLNVRDAVAVLEQAVVANRVLAAGAARLQRIAAAGVVAEVSAPISVAEAIKGLR